MNTTSTFGTVKRILAILIAVAVVLAAGAIVGQAPAIFGSEVAEDYDASIEFSDQNGDGTNVTIDRVSLSDGGFVVVRDGSDTIVGVSDYLEDGDHENVTVDQRDDTEMFGQLTAVVHRDTTNNETFAYEETDGEEDRPYLEDGYPVSDTATVTVTERAADGTANTSFLVESVDAPSSAGINETITVEATIRNPNAFDTRQHVEFRIDGEVLDRRVLDLAADETTDVTFEVDVVGVEPGNHTYGVYTTDHGELGDLEVVDE